MTPAPRPAVGRDQQFSGHDFADLAGRFAEKLEHVRHHTEPRYVRTDWTRRNAELERDLLPVPPQDFLRHPAIRFQMFVDEYVVPHELPWIRTYVSDIEVLAESPVGAPPMFAVPDSSVQTSSNTVHQAYHLLRHQDASGRQLSEADTIVEWVADLAA
ncbi:hypothetical protein [Mycolicibacterium hippocampi]|uniref:Uncharacterized protein n=1 Tax=Mycolicibacterium hippocampi TaxID=659824 RepID=A0A7I9ZH36_9MYCO|nr:hypothetical protein [Mycolicibacterium hippocampi]GFH00244.1 hypothetical protein MHIP_07270 [Mycolicibacterium hippocampi]